MSLIILMPAYNESACIAAVARAWLSILDRVPGHLMVVNDGSTDDTGAILDRLAATEPRLIVHHQKNAGHGAAVMHGYRAALERGCEYVFQTDSDDQFEKEDFWKLWARRAEAPLVMGHRKHRHDPFSRRFISRVMSLGLAVMFGTRLKDPNIPFRLYRAGFLRTLLDRIPGGVFAPNIFLSMMACRELGKICYLEITHRARHTGKVSIFGWKLCRICVRCVRELATLRCRLWQHALRPAAALAQLD